MEADQETWTCSSSIMADELIEILGYDHSTPKNVWITLLYY